MLILMFWGPIFGAIAQVPQRKIKANTPDFKSGNQDSALVHAAQMGRTDCVRLLLEAGTPANASEYVRIQTACTLQ
jgi:hypothetical protein